MHLMSSTLKADESGEPFHVQQRKQIEVFQAAWKEAGHLHEPRVSVSRSIMPSSPTATAPTSATRATARTRSATSRPTCGRCSAAATPPSPTRSSSSWPRTRPSAADTLLLTVPNQLGVEYNAHLLESLLKDVAPELGWR